MANLFLALSSNLPYPLSLIKRQWALWFPAVPYHTSVFDPETHTPQAHILQAHILFRLTYFRVERTNYPGVKGLLDSQVELDTYPPMDAKLLKARRLHSSDYPKNIIDNFHIHFPLDFVLLEGSLHGFRVVSECVS